MKLIVGVSVLCILLIAFMQRMRRPAAVINNRSGSEYIYPTLAVVLFWFAITFVSAFRQGFQDTGVYKNLYASMGGNIENAFDEEFAVQDRGFNIYMVVLNWINPDPQFLVIVSAVITLSAYIYVVAKYARDLPFSLLLLLCTAYISSMNGIRQILAGAVFMLALPWMRDRKIIPYMLLVWFLSSFHGSLIIMIPLYFVISGKRMNKGILLFLILVALCFLAPSLADRAIGTMLEDSIYAEYLDNESQMGMMRFLVALVPTVLSLLYCMVQKNNHCGEDRTRRDYLNQRMIDVLINMQIVSFGFTALGLKMVYFARISMYFSCVLPILLPETIRGCFAKRSARLIKQIAIAMYLFYYAYQIYTYNINGGWNGFELVI